MSITAPAGTGHGEQRWLVRLEYLRPTRFGEEATSAAVWVVRPTFGRGAARYIIGGPTLFATRRKALAYAHAQARRTYGTPRNRKDIPA
jgi:hypothetical protein